MNPFAAYTKNVTSQFGEDGIIAELFKRIGTTSKLCVEFGAWDGKHCSNTWKLWHEEGWAAVLIESLQSRVDRLRLDLAGYPKVIPHVAFVKAEGPQSLDAMLPALVGTQAIDLMSIDIDSDDGLIFEKLQTYLPRVAIIEYNPTIPPHMSLMQKEGEYCGTSAKALVDIGKKKGYTLIALTTTNCFFVKDEELPKLQLDVIPTLEELFQYENLTYVISSYGGGLAATRVPMYSKTELLCPVRSAVAFEGDHKLVPILHFKTKPFHTLLIQRIAGKLRSLFGR